MKRTTTIVLAASIALSMTACEALDSLLQVNIFAGFYTVSKDDVESSKSDAPALVVLAESDTFFETLADPANSVLKVDVLATITEAIALATEPAVVQDLTLLGAEIELRTTGGDVVVNNIAGVLVDQTAIKTDGNIDPAKLLTAIMPLSVVDDNGDIIDEATFKDIIDGFVAASTFYDQLGTSLAGGTYEDTTVDAGTVLQSAVVAATLASLTIPADKTAGEYLLSLADGTATYPAIFNFPVMTAGTSLGNLFTAAGVNPADLGL